MCELSVCLYRLNGPVDELAQYLENQFRTVCVVSTAELHSALRQHLVFCTVVAGKLRAGERANHLANLCRMQPRIPWIFYGGNGSAQAAEVLAGSGPADVVAAPDRGELLAAMREAHAQARFEIDLADFGIHPERHRSFWVQRFFNFVGERLNFLSCPRVDQVAEELGVSRETLSRGLKQAGLPSPKQILLVLRLYYSSYLLHTTGWPAKAVVCKR